jgi:6-phosphofructokinase 1
MSNKLNCIVAQSGGPTSVINASLAGVIEAALNNNHIDKVYGAIHGINGVLRNSYIELNELFSNHDNIELLKTTPSMYLGSCRHKLPSVSQDSTEYEAIFSFFKRMNIGFFFYIGGNDSMDTVDKLNKYAISNGIKNINIIGIPKTIDNDLYGTDHSPGFGSAAKFIATSLLEVIHDTYIYDLQSVTIVEIMGRNAGWLTAAAALARTGNNTSPDLIYLPERVFSTSQFIDDINTVLRNKKNVIIAVSEGIKNKDGEYIAASSTDMDQFGHFKLSGVGNVLEHLVTTEIGCKVRSIELSVLQRSASHISSLTDVTEAFLVGNKAVEFATSGISGAMIVINRETTSPYKSTISSLPINKIANLEKVVPLEWINEAGNDISEDFIAYMAPLIKGETKIEYENGIPKYMPIDHLFNSI